MELRDKILDYIRLNGPSLPIQVAKQIAANTLIASAHLSELVSNKALRISAIKVGGSPLYFLPTQESQLQKFSQHLHEKEKVAYDLLNSKKLLRDSDLEPVIRVALRSIKDFAVPLMVNSKGASDIFWKWFLLPGPDAEKTIRAMFQAPEDKNAEEKPAETQQKLVKTKKPEPELKPQAKDSFIDAILRYFVKNSIDVVEQKILRKDAEAEFIVKLPSGVGPLTYYCRAKSKKKLNEGDLSAAFIYGQTKKLPVLLLTKGDMTKKAAEMLEGEFKGISVRKI